MDMGLSEEPWAEHILMEAEKRLGFPVRQVLERGEGGTDVVQPAIFLVEWLATEALVRTGVRPRVVCGHSLGEFAALAAASVLTWDETLRLVALRGRLMAEAAARHPGAMAAILASGEEVERIAAEAACYAVNYNAPGQVVVSGTEEAVGRAISLAKSRGLRVIPLNVSGPFHTPIMGEAEEAFREALARVSFRRPAVIFVSAVSGRPEADPGRIRALMEVQMTSPVRWVEVIRSLEELGVTEAVEAGPGAVLTKLGRRTSRRISFRTLREVL